MSVSSIKMSLPLWLTKSKRLQIAALVCVGLVALDLAVYSVALAPASARLVEREARYAELRKRNADALLFQKQKEAFAGLKAGIPAQKDMPLLVKDLVQIAKKHRLAVGGISYDIPRHGSEGLTMLSFSLPVSGTYPDVKRFIYEVETSDRLLGVQDLKFDSEKAHVKLQMKLVTYIKGE